MEGHTPDSIASSVLDSPAGDTGDLIQKYSDQFGVDSSLVRALTSQESGGHAGATSYKGAGGLMQIMPGTAKQIAEELGETYSPEKLYDPDTNVRWGTYYLAQNLAEFGGDERKAVAAYHAGPGAVKAANSRGLEIPETSDGLITTQGYVDSIMAKKAGATGQTPSLAVQPQSGFSSPDDIVNFVLGVPAASPQDQETVQPSALKETPESIVAKVVPTYPAGAIPVDLSPKSDDFSTRAYEESKKVEKQNVPNPAEAFAMGIVKSTPAPLIMSKESKKAIEEKIAASPVAGAAGEITGTLGQMVGVGGAIGAGKKVAEALSYIKNPTLLRAIQGAVNMGTAGAVVTGAQQVDPVLQGKESIKDALLNTAESAAGNAIGVVPGVVMAKNALRLLADPAANILFQVGADAARGRSMTDKDAVKRYVVAGLLSAGGAIVDLHSGERFDPATGKTVEQWSAERPDATLEVVQTSEKPVVAEAPKIDFGKPSAEIPPENIDNLTGLQNANTIHQKIEQANVDPSKDVMIIDIDDAKAINDTYGHDEANKVWTAMGSVIKNHFPEADVGRWGGEEFAIILPKGERAAAQNLLKDIPNRVKIYDESVTVSGGVGDNFKQADDNLYKSKQTGKNQIFIDNGSENPYTIQGSPVGEKGYVTSTDLRQVAQRAARLLGSSKVSSPEDRSALERAIQAVERIQRGNSGREAGGPPVPEQPVGPRTGTFPGLSETGSIAAPKVSGSVTDPEAILKEVDLSANQGLVDDNHLYHSLEVSDYATNKALYSLTSYLQHSLDPKSFSQAGDPHKILDNSRWITKTGGTPIDRARMDFISDNRAELRAIGIDPENIQTPSDFIDFLDSIHTKKSLATLRNKAFDSFSKNDPETEAYNKLQDESRSNLLKEHGYPPEWDIETPGGANDLTPVEQAFKSRLDAHLNSGKPLEENPPLPPGPAQKISGASEPEINPSTMGGIAFGQKLPEMAGNIKLKNIDADYGPKKALVDFSDQYKGKIDEARRGKITLETTRLLADDLGISETQLLKRRKGQAWNAEELLGARDLLNSSAQRIVKIRDEFYKKGPDKITDEDLLTFNLEMRKHAAIQAEVSGLTAEAGRALSSFRILSEAKKKAGSVQSLLDQAGGREINREMLDKLLAIDPNDQAALNGFVKKSLFARTRDQVYEYWINAILSSPKTHAANIASNTLATLSRTMIEKPVAAITESVLAKSQGRAPTRFLGEVPAEIVGSVSGVLDAVKAFKHTFETGVSSLGPNKTELTRDVAIPGRLGKIIRVPTRMLAAADEFFKTVVYRGEISSLAYRKAKTEGLKGDAIGKRMDDILLNIDKHPDIQKGAWREAQYRTFTKPLGKFGTQLIRLRDTSGIAKYIVPFIKTPTNVMKYALERAPLTSQAVLIKKIRAGELKGADLSDQIAKMAVGSALAVPIVMWAKSGIVTGSGPKDTKERNAMRRTGWQPYSIKVGDKYVSYARFEPLGSQLGLVADFSTMDIDKEGEDKANRLAGQIAYSIGNNVLNKTFMQQLSNLVDATSDPGRYGKNFTTRLATSFVPNIVASAAGAADKTVRNPADIGQAMKTKIPGVGKNVVPRRDIWGQEIQNEGNPVYRFLFPANISADKNSKVDEEILRLEMSPGMPDKYLTIKKEKVNLTEQEYDDFIVKSGEMARKNVERFVNSRGYERMDDQAKKDRIEALISDARSSVRDRLKIEKMRKK